MQKQKEAQALIDVDIFSMGAKSSRCGVKSLQDGSIDPQVIKKAAFIHKDGGVPHTNPEEVI